MSQHRDAIGDRVLTLWKRLAPYPGGRWLFSRILGNIAPYTGSIGASVKELRPGYARIELRDRRKVRNHLNSVHAIALMNLGEVATGLALMTGLRPGIRGIITGLSIEYLKKARGRLVAVSETEQPEVREELQHEVIAVIKDQSGDVVARCTANWRLGLTP